ncbi:MAG: hypothetical protein JST68_21325 [Bacteroidetes bacterium]|nr:hypothetical protein [Bacteroidota bacterium]
MELETAAYIVHFFSRLLTDNERRVLHYDDLNKGRGKFPGTLRSSPLPPISSEEGPHVLELFKDGYDAFILNTAQRIIANDPGKVFLNTCPGCGKLARTPQAKQCRYCGLSWHDRVAGEIQFQGAFRLGERNRLVIVVTPRVGRFTAGMRLDLTMLGVGRKPVVLSIEFVYSQEPDKRNDLGFIVEGLDEEEEEYLRRRGKFATALLVEK